MIFQRAHFSQAQAKVTDEVLHHFMDPTRKFNLGFF